MVKVIMEAPHGVSGAFVKGTNYTIKDGLCEVDGDHVPHLQDHGFKLSDKKLNSEEFVEAKAKKVKKDA